ncbi:cytochrome c oxidase assembly factor 5 [Trichonephila clavata]|uniref:Cytochrome c oxidase assembly factor 5 n=1 Tax=Trichonephila clavata TaxID=2740835 RepID=A0A8X6KHA6_TRICU|nr:cytochrome c oxidase assembly factor 5 [Trichonephila clavata]
MPIYTEEDEITKYSKPCSGVREDLLLCLKATDCVKIQKRTPKDCLLSRDPSVPDNCYSLRTLFFECKRSLLDNRQRFRGRKGY